MPLTDAKIRTAKPQPERKTPPKLTDGGGLYLEILHSGVKSWRYSFSLAGKKSKMVFGTYPDITLSEARRLHAEARKLVSQGINPAEEKKRQKSLQKASAQNTFRALAQEWQETKRTDWTPAYASAVGNIFTRDVYPAIGSRTITDITPMDMLDFLRRIELRGAVELAKKTRQRCSEVFRYAIGTGRATMNPAAELAPAMKKRESRHYPFLLATELPDFLRAVTAYSGSPITKHAARLLALTGTRTADIRFMEWQDINLDSGDWFLAEGKRTKSTKGRSLTIPLPVQAINILKEMQAITGKYKYVFANRNNVSDVISENTITKMIQLIGYKGRMTGHGFRHTASTILNEQGYNPDWIEVQLAHVDRNNIRGTYNHAAYLEDRRHMMQWYADYLDSLERGGNVVHGSFGKTRKI